MLKWLNGYNDKLMFLLLAAAVFAGVACLDGPEGGMPQTLAAVLQFVAEETPHA